MYVESALLQIKEWNKKKKQQRLKKKNKLSLGGYCTRKRTGSFLLSDMVREYQTPR